MQIIKAKCFHWNDKRNARTRDLFNMRFQCEKSDFDRISDYAFIFCNSILVRLVNGPCWNTMPLPITGYKMSRGWFRWPADIAVRVSTNSGCGLQVIKDCWSEFIWVTRFQIRIDIDGNPTVPNWIALIWICSPSSRLEIDRFFQTSTAGTPISS